MSQVHSWLGVCVFISHTQAIAAWLWLQSSISQQECFTVRITAETNIKTFLGGGHLKNQSSCYIYNALGCLEEAKLAWNRMLTGYFGSSIYVSKHNSYFESFGSILFFHSPKLDLEILLGTDARLVPQHPTGKNIQTISQTALMQMGSPWAGTCPTINSTAALALPCCSARPLVSLCPSSTGPASPAAKLH